ncbi:uncharacterized protein H6S33_004939 [Morchella sextelata]|uniref:uncharacterized protein n=1 Tax=Morchella sextelata TaxID=1174677 RepID=UPI001D053D09|nr:uncharacterized protein H6S33_004939 [Morchella sextelata]KAH0604957.1 hypothetical protein H6S33_004939 [Morchella sextelata]
MTNPERTKGQANQTARYWLLPLSHRSPSSAIIPGVSITRNHSHYPPTDPVHRYPTHRRSESERKEGKEAIAIQPWGSPPPSRALEQLNISFKEEVHTREWVVIGQPGTCGGGQNRKENTGKGKTKTKTKQTAVPGVEAKQVNL